ncbi:hypothetical protein COBT_002567 [Conglomerata obtusa]
MHAQEIDKLFLSPSNHDDHNALETIQEYLKNASTYKNNLDTITNDVNDHLKLYKYYHLKLEALSKEITDIETKNDLIKRQIKNKQDTYNELKDLLVSIEIKEEHFTALIDPDFTDLTRLQISLNVLKSFYADYDIKVVNDKRVRVTSTLKEFISAFTTFFQNKLNSFTTESKGELKIHSRVYDDIKKYDFIVDYCKESNKEGFVILSRKYLSSVKCLYEKEFEMHFSFVLKALKGYKNKLKNKMEEVISVIFESFYVIIKCEDNFIRNFFSGNDEFIDDFLYSMFIDVINIINDFLRDCYKLNSIFIINAIYKSKDVKEGFEDYDIQVIKSYKNSLKTVLNDLKYDYLRIEKSKLKTEGRKKTIRNLIEDIKNNSYEEMNEESLRIIIDEIKILQRKNKGKIEFILYKFEIITELSKLENEKYEKEIKELKTKVNKEYEKELIGYVFGGDEKSLKMRIENVLELITEVAGNNEFFFNNIKEITREIVIDNSNLDKKDKIGKYFM